MKKNIVLFIAALSTFSLMAFGYMNWNNSSDQYSNSTTRLDNNVSSGTDESTVIDLPIMVGSRFKNTITKERMHKAISVVDLIPNDGDYSNVSFQNIAVAIIHVHGETREVGNNRLLNDAQINLLQTADYSTNFLLEGKRLKKIGSSNDLKERDLIESEFTYYMSVVPAKEAYYTAGHDALILYLKENSKAATTNIKKGTLQPGKVAFTVSKDGSIKHVAQELESGYSVLDQAMLNLINHAPEKWEPAENSKGEKVDQELVLSYARVGC